MKRGVLLLALVFSFTAIGCSADAQHVLRYAPLDGASSNGSVDAVSDTTCESNRLQSQNAEQSQEADIVDRSVIRLSSESANAFNPDVCFEYDSDAVFALDDGCTAFTLNDGIVFDATGTVLLRCPLGKSGTVSVPEGTVTIAQAAFQHCASVTEIRLPDSLREIRANAFRDCHALTSIDVPSCVDFTGTNTFFGCRSLTNVHLIGRSRAPSSWPSNWLGLGRSVLMWDK